jgi:hypothetical protein
VGAGDLGFQTVAMATMSEYWPVFAACAAIDIWVVRRIQRSRRFRVQWIAGAAMAAALLSAVLWAESFLVTQLTYETVGEGARVNAWQQLWSHLSRSWPLLAALGAVLLGLARPRGDAVVIGMVAAAGVIASWMVAMWLFTTNHLEALFQIMVLPGGLGVVASLVGFTAATGMWMAIGRWVWKQGRRRRRRGITAHADEHLPELRR